MTEGQTAPRLTQREIQIRRRMRDDFPHYAAKALRIRTKAAAVKPLILNTAQLYIHARLEAQLKQAGKIRAIVLKGRQQGCSTYVEGRFFHRITHRRGVKGYILTHNDDATTTLFEMTKRYLDHCPALLKPAVRKSNSKVLQFNRLDSGYAVATAGSKGAGRSDTLQYFHGSEVAYWPNAEDHVKGALQAVPNAPGTEVILESTSAGRQGLFYRMCNDALQGVGEFILIFVPWFWQPEYRLPVPGSFEITGEEKTYREKHGLDLEQVTWRRAKIIELRGIHNFRREYPATVEEAFRAEAPGALWRRELIEIHRETRSLAEILPTLRRIVVGVDPSGGDEDTNDEQGIIAGGIGENGQAYVLADESGHFTPNGWGERTVALYSKLKADRVIGEKNFGGDMVEYVIRTVAKNPDGTSGKNVSYKDVVASRGKAVRAEPVAALYERGLVHHVGNFPALEDEQCTWDPLTSKESPNRVDALVWVLTELMLGESETGLIDFYGQELKARREAADQAKREGKHHG